MKLFLDVIKKAPKTIAAKYVWKIILRSKSTGRILMERQCEYQYKKDANKTIKWIQKDQSK